MLRIGAISNARSKRNRRRLLDMREAFAGHAEVRHVELEGVAGLEESLAEFAADGVGLLLLSGGDGTVQAALTALFRRRVFETVPILAVLPRGTTNMIAADAGVAPARLSRLLSLAREEALAPLLVERRVLRLENARDTGPLYGMFFGGAGIYRAIVACRAQVQPWRLVADAAAAVTLIGLLGRWFVAGGRDDEVVHGDRIGLTVDGVGIAARDYLLVLATTLDRLLLGSRPFWSDGGGDFRFTSIAYPPRRLLRHARAVLYGGSDRRLPEGYDSTGASSVELAMDCPFTLDGELYEPAPGKPVVLTAPETVRMVRL
jgi:Diacylglycerol kinase catalytic domain